MKLFFTLVLFVFSHSIFSQTSLLKGTIIDDKTGKTIPGVDVNVSNTKFSTSSDFDGNFIISDLPIGTYEVQFSTSSYKTKIISEVVVTANEGASLTVSLVESQNELKEVVITKTKAKVESVKSLLIQQKNSVSVSDGISAESIKRTPDKSTSDVLKRISGASIQDNKFVIVRGLNDRYNTAYLNGAPLPSSEPDRKAFSFDMFPSNMLDNLVITKTATPDLPGEFAGGVIQINTKSVPDKKFQSLSIGGSYNTITTGKKQVTYNGGSTDFIGIDDGTRALSSSIPSVADFLILKYPEKVEIAKNSTTDWSLINKKFSPNINFQYTIGNQFSIKDKKIGVLAAVTYSKSNNYNEREITDFGFSGINKIKTTDLKDDIYSTQILASGLANFSLKLNKNNLVNFKNIYSINSDDRVIERNGIPANGETADYFITYGNARWFTSNKIYSGQINGDHYLPNSRIRLAWVGSLSDVDRSIPNLRRNIYNKRVNEPGPFQAYIPESGAGPEDGGSIFYSENKENIKSFKTDISKKFVSNEDLSTEIKIGAAYQERKRDFFSRQFGYITGGNPSKTFDTSLLLLDDSEIFNPNNFGILPSGKVGFSLYESTKYTDSYDASSALRAAYGMMDNIIHKSRLIWGLRVESYNQILNALKDRYTSLNLNNEQTDFLPSINYIYGINRKQNLRISFSKTLNRPEFRELAPFAFYDFTTKFVTTGNENLKISKINNFDIRYEIYPANGQLFTFSIFYKKFTNPIESKANGNPNEISFQNAPSAINSGFEFEFRTLLSSFFNKASETNFLNNITLFTNFSAIYSNVDLGNLAISSDPEKSRPMQGQSPYVLNSGIQYMNEQGLTIAANLNRVGNRIAIVGNIETQPTLWEKSRTFLDMQVSKSFIEKKLEIKLNIQNILGQDLIFYNNNDAIAFIPAKDKENLPSSFFSIFDGVSREVKNFTNSLKNYNNWYNSEKDDVVWKTKYGRTFSISISYNF